ncbi:glycosyltransferase family 25 protein [Marinobacterium sediminicola]|uniref:Glycosyltransferase involved in LPS biosynthesis, GR25 family n=1 Tax=Marinobacterium sediminicola TaxID=518898 RepID=A0ABY1RZ82_9GAMM|nr:glycosyltransferase family 25 protein [Marinobacterium sediminicola]ULG69103.1 glycosyltransferase family 25 protein [Marinobacterium sediminicola]SMR73619.1 Glycosyltransferase involved in LPS biosynthesis, GR25 family [Marinobacterium sediminicola]
MCRFVSWKRAQNGECEIPVAIISLAGARDRRNILLEKKFPSEWVEDYWPASDMRYIPFEELNSSDLYIKMKEFYSRDILPGEIGCLQSHAKVIEWFFKETESPLLMILEDDVTSSEAYKDGCLEKIAPFLYEEAIKGGAFICHLGPRGNQWKKAASEKIFTVRHHKYKISFHKHVDKKRSLWLAHAYIISREAAKRYIRCFDQGFLADDWGRIKEICKMDITYVVPGLFYQEGDIESSIDPDNKRNFSFSNNVRKRGLKRFFEYLNGS